MPTQAEKARTFQSLHQRAGAFLIPNPWDAGSARVLAHLGFEALATTSAGHAFSLGLPDGSVTREMALEHARAIVSATMLPVSADFENGFGDRPEHVAETVRLAAAAGLAGCSIEDRSRAQGAGIYEVGAAVERIRAAAEAAHALPFPFTLTARTENFLAGRPDLRDTIARLQAFQDAGADVLYAPGLPAKDAIAEVVRSVDRPVNVVMGLGGGLLTLDELSAIGVKRVSVGGSLARAALGGLLRAAREMKSSGTFSYSKDAISHREINAIFEGFEQ